MFLVFGVLFAPVQCAKKVELGFYSESLCPDCIAYANGPLEKAMNEVSTMCTRCAVFMCIARLMLHGPSETDFLLCSRSNEIHIDLLVVLQFFATLYIHNLQIEFEGLSTPEA